MRKLKLTLNQIFLKHAFHKYKYVVLICCFWGLFYFFQNNGVNNHAEMKEILKTIITIIGVSLALIVSFLIAKLYFDKTIGIERKKIKDSYTKKLTGLRLLLKHVFDNHDFWTANTKNIKCIIEKYHSTLSYKSFNKLSLLEKEKIATSIGFNTTLIMCFLAIRDIVEYKKTLDVNNPEVEYNLKELNDLNEMFYKASLLFDKSHCSSLPDFNNVHDGFSYEIPEILKICGVNIKTPKLSNDDLNDIFSNYHEGYIDKIKKFSQQTISINAKLLQFNFLIYLAIILLSIVFLSVNNVTYSNVFYGNIIITTLIINTIDLTINIFKLVKAERELIEGYPQDS